MQELLQKIGVNINITFHLIFLGLIWVRVLAMATIIPFLFGKPVPRYVVVAASMVLAIFAYPHLVPLHPPELGESLLPLFMLYLKEAFYGVMMGLAASAIFYGFQAVGVMIDNQRGLSIARLLIPQLGEQGSLSGAFLFQLSIVIYLSTGGHRVFLDAFFQSFNVLPVLAFPTAGPGWLSLIDLFVHITGEVLIVSIQLAAPVIIAIFLADIILGIANRIAPQINVWELGFNVKGYVGILILFVALTLMTDQMQKYTARSNRYVERVVENLQGKAAEVKPEEAVIPEEGLPQPEAGPPPVQSP